MLQELIPTHSNPTAGVSHPYLAFHTVFYVFYADGFPAPQTPFFGWLWKKVFEKKVEGVVLMMASVLCSFIKTK